MGVSQSDFKNHGAIKKRMCKKDRLKCFDTNYPKNIENRIKI
jgi:hypothetical protein